MSTPAETLSQMIEALTEESSKARRRTHANAAYTALRQMQEAQPPADADAAERRGHERGLLEALGLARHAQRRVDDPIRKASYDASVRHASGAINALFHYADTVLVDFERLVNQALRAPYKKETP